LIVDFSLSQVGHKLDFKQRDSRFFDFSLSQAGRELDFKQRNCKKWGF